MHRRPSSVLVALLKSIPPGTVKVSLDDPPDLLVDDPFGLDWDVCLVDAECEKSFEVWLNKDKGEASASLLEPPAKEVWNSGEEYTGGRWTGADAPPLPRIVWKLEGWKLFCECEGEKLDPDEAPLENATAVLKAEDVGDP